MDTLLEMAGLGRSLLIYYAPFRIRRMIRFYGQFIQPGELCFDLGAHVGNRIRAWSQLGARVVAVEPLPLCMQLLERWYGLSPDVVLVQAAVAGRAGEAEMLISSRTPTVATLSAEWAARVRRASSFSRVRWDRRLIVPVTTLDELIAIYGVPAFVKIDVEGFELQALLGLSRALPAFSFEYIPATIDIALDCIARLDGMGEYRFNCSPRETFRYALPRWVSSGEMSRLLKALPRERISGDVYAVLAGNGKSQTL